jgi:putative spermidine/putrescine transport system ATP-binding protein
MNLLELQGIRRRYGSVMALDGVDLSVAADSCTAVVGPSGSGKTTLLRIIAGFDAADAGRVVLDGEILTDGTKAVPAHRREIGYVAQDGALFPHLSIAENIGFGLPRRDSGRDVRIAELIRMVDLDPAILGRRPDELSGGQQQRIALARSLITEPRVLLLDEPLSALDPFLRVRMREELKRLQRELGITFIHVTHSQDEAMALADLVVVMNQGKIEQSAPPREVFNRPASAFVAKFIGGHNVLPAAVARAKGEAAFVAIRADRMTVQPGVAPTDASSLTGVARSVEYLGSTVQVGIDVIGLETLSAIVPEARFDAAPVAPGQPVTLSWMPGDVHALGR